MTGVGGPNLFNILQSLLARKISRQDREECVKSVADRPVNKQANGSWGNIGMGEKGILDLTTSVSETLPPIHPFFIYRTSLVSA